MRIAYLINSLDGYGAGLPIPAYPSLIVGGAVAQSGHGPTLAEVMAAGVLACVVADLLWYGMGRRHGARLMRGICRISLSPDTCVRSTSTTSWARACCWWPSSCPAPARSPP